MRIVITAGGTGGHIFPAIAIIRKLQELDKNVEILYIGTKDRMEATIIPKMGISYVGIEMIGLNRKNVFKNVKTIQCLFNGVKKAKREKATSIRCSEIRGRIEKTFYKD